jgi:transposase-like protein
MGAPFDLNDPEDIMTMFWYAFGVNKYESIANLGLKSGPRTAEYLGRQALRSGIREAMQKVAARLGGQELAKTITEKALLTEIVADCSQNTLRAIIRGRIDPQSIVCSDGWPGYDGLVDVGYDKHIRINKKKSFTKGRAHIHGIEAFWSFTKRRLAKFNGVKVNFALHFKECERRYNKSSSFLFKNLLTLIKNPIKVLV